MKHLSKKLEKLAAKTSVGFKSGSGTQDREVGLGLFGQRGFIWQHLSRGTWSGHGSPWLYTLHRHGMIMLQEAISSTLHQNKESHNVESTGEPCLCLLLCYKRPSFGKCEPTGLSFPSRAALPAQLCPHTCTIRLRRMDVFQNARASSQWTK